MRSILLTDPRFFFEPVDLNGQAADLAVQLGDLLFVFGLPVLLALVIIGKQFWKVFQCLFFPAVQHIGMHPVFRCDLADRFFFFQDLQRDLRFLTGGKVFSFEHGDSSLPPYFCPFSCPIFLSHLTGKDWLAFRPDSILRTYGVPKRIDVNMGEGPEGRVIYEFVIFYDQMYIKYTGHQIIILPQKILHACPVLDHNIESFEIRIGKYDEKIRSEGVDITRMTSLTLDRFYKILTGDPDMACFNLDYQKFLDQYKK